MVELRKIKVAVESVHHEGGPPLAEPLRVGAALAVVRNPFAGRYEPDLMPFMAELREVGESLAVRLIEALGGVEHVEAYGKGAIVGEDGELEHGALWHEAGGWAMRAALGEPSAIVPSSKTVAGLGSRLMVPLGHIDAAYVRSHFGTAELSVWDGPRRSEILYGLVMATGSRPHARCGGLSADEIQGADGPR
nr:amino acid synthesis family protein [Nitriliruptor alkaliphilus]